MIYYKGHTISAEFAGIGKPDSHIVRRLSACGNVGMSLLGSFPTLDEAKAAINASAPVTADALTDEQLEALLKTAIADEDIELVVLCETALKTIVQPNLKREAVTRIAEILNARRAA